MSTKQVEQYECVRRQQNVGDGLSESRHQTLGDKLIVDVQVCLDCGKAFLPTRGRKRCPCCRGVLRNKTTILQKL